MHIPLVTNLLIIFFSKKIICINTFNSPGSSMNTYPGTPPTPLFGSLPHIEYMTKSFVEYLLRNCFNGSISVKQGGHHLTQKIKIDHFSTIFLEHFINRFHK